MTVTTVNGGSEAFDALVYAPLDNNALNYMQNNMQEAYNALSGVHDEFIQETNRIYNMFNSNEAINRAKMIVSTVGGGISTNTIYEVPVEDMGNANYIMQQYIIANPTINQYVQDDILYGFQTTYYNEEIGVYGKERNDYRRVMDGVIEFEDDESFSTRYISSDDTEIDTLDRMSILNTWDNALKLLANDIDPTSPDGDEI